MRRLDLHVVLDEYVLNVGVRLPPRTCVWAPTSFGHRRTRRLALPGFQRHDAELILRRSRDDPIAVAEIDEGAPLGVVKPHDCRVL